MSALKLALHSSIADLQLAMIALAAAFLLKGEEFAEYLKMGRASLTENDRTKYYALAQQRVTAEHLWMPVMNIAMYTTSLKKLKGVRPHMLYQNTFYKGLDYAF